MLAGRFSGMSMPVAVLGLLFLDAGYDPLFLDVDPDKSIEAHINVGDPNHGKTGDQVSTPIGEEQVESRHGEHKDRDVVAKAIFTGKQVEKFPGHDRTTILAACHTIFPRLPENLLVCHRPRNAGGWDSEYKQPYQLFMKLHGAYGKKLSARPAVNRWQLIAHLPLLHFFLPNAASYGDPMNYI